MILRRGASQHILFNTTKPSALSHCKLDADIQGATSEMPKDVALDPEPRKALSNHIYLLAGFVSEQGLSNRKLNTDN